mgnify:FL=1
MRRPRPSIQPVPLSGAEAAVPEGVGRRREDLADVREAGLVAEGVPVPPVRARGREICRGM